jgi:uncharacterized membrane protein YdfJ with MMPL/SSD domain
MISIFLGFAFTKAVETRQFGLGMAFAIFLDAALICTILIPTTMRLLKDWNWWWPFKKKSPILSQIGVNPPTQLYRPASRADWPRPRSRAEHHKPAPKGEHHRSHSKSDHHKPDS